MSVFQMKLPDVGEGVAEAEIVDWLVEVGDEVTPDSVLAEVLTDKATVEVSSPVTGVVTALHGEPGDVVAVGSELVDIDVNDASGPDVAPEPAPAEPEGALSAPAGAPEPPPELEVPASDAQPPSADGAQPGPPRPTAAPAVRARARDLGIDLGSVRGTGPDGRVVHADLDRLRSVSGPPSTSDAPRTRSVRGVRRKIAERLSAAWSEIPHITYVDTVDVGEVERLRSHLNDRLDTDTDTDATRLTLLPFVARAVVLACADQPELNAHYDHAAQSLDVFGAVHVGIATQTDNGLLVPVVRHAEALDIRSLARAIAEVTTAARDGLATRDQLSGSTITITSLGSIGGVVTTPIVNAPEVAIIGVNKMEVRPVWMDGAFVPRTVLNLSSSFDHRMVDGWDAAIFVQRIKALLETPALLFVDA